MSHALKHPSGCLNPFTQSPIRLGPTKVLRASSGSYDQTFCWFRVTIVNNYHLLAEFMICDLSHLRDGDSASILDIDADEALSSRLNALGFRSGKVVTVLRHGILQGPLQVAVGTTQIILRRSDAARIRVNRKS